MLAAKLTSLNSISGPHMVEGKNGLSQFVQSLNARTHAHKMLKIKWPSGSLFSSHSHQGPGQAHRGHLGNDSEKPEAVSLPPPAHFPSCDIYILSAKS